MASVVVPRWSLLAGAFALVAALAFSVGSFYTARGDNHEATYYACLYAGSLSQVGTTQPTNCGRGEVITLSAGLNSSQAGKTISGYVYIDGPENVPDTPATAYGGGFTLTEHSNTAFTITFPPGTSDDSMACSASVWDFAGVQISLGNATGHADGSRSQEIFLSGEAYGFQFVCSEVQPT